MANVIMMAPPTPAAMATTMPPSPSAPAESAESLVPTGVAPPSCGDGTPGDGGGGSCGGGGGGNSGGGEGEGTTAIPWSMKPPIDGPADPACTCSCTSTLSTLGSEDASEGSAMTTSTSRLPARTCQYTRTRTHNTQCGGGEDYVRGWSKSMGEGNAPGRPGHAIGRCAGEWQAPPQRRFSTRSTASSPARREQ